MSGDRDMLIPAEVSAAEREQQSSWLPKSLHLPLLLLVGCNTAFMLWKLSPAAFGSLKAVFPAKGTDSITLHATSSNCSLEGPSLGAIASPRYRKQEEWPELNSKAYEAISMCLTQVPQCNPANLHGDPDVRSTYRRASGSNEATAYLAILENGPLMNQLQAHMTCGGTAIFFSGLTDNCISVAAFEEALMQINKEVSHLQTVAAYFSDMSELLEGLGMQMDAQLESMSQLLLESSLAITTTTTTAGRNALKTFKKVLTVSLEIGILAGTGMSLAGEGSASAKKVAKVGQTMASVCTVGDESMVLVDQGAEASGDDGGDDGDGDDDGQAGAEDDDKLDVLELDVKSLVSQVVQNLQDQMSLARQQLSSNWGRLEQAMRTTRSCSFDDQTILMALQRSKSAIEWGALSLLMPAKYVMYFQRNYGPSAGNQEWCQNICANEPLGCSTITNVHFDLCAGSNPTSDDDDETVSRVYWMGQVGQPNHMPPASFWNYLLRKDGPVQKFINPRYGLSVTTPEELVSAVVQQCKYVQKTYVTSAEAITGPSLHAMECYVFGMPWPVYSYPDCVPTGFVKGTYDETFGCPIGYACTQSHGCQVPAANFNSQVLVAPVKGHVSELTFQNKPSLVGCCQPFAALDAMAATCDFAVCDCSTLLAFLYKGNAASDPTTGQDFNEDWFGACTSKGKSISDYSDSFDLRYQTSLGVTWQEIFDNYDYLANQVVSKVYAVGSDGAGKPRVWMSTQTGLNSDGYWLAIGDGHFSNVIADNLTIYGIDSDLSLFKHHIKDLGRGSLIWHPATTGKITAFQIYNGTAWAIDSESGAVVTQEMSKMRATSVWSQASAGTITALQVYDGSIYGLNAGLQVVSQPLSTMTVESNWNVASLPAITAFQIVKGTIYGLGTNNCMYSQQLSSMTSTSTWDGPSIGSIIYFQIGVHSIYGIGMGGNGIWRQPLSSLMSGGTWQQVSTKTNLWGLDIQDNIPANQATESIRSSFRLERHHQQETYVQDNDRPTQCTKHSQCNFGQGAVCANGNSGVESCGNSGCHADCDYYENIPYKCCHCGR
eukprot:TRINITY_DN13232_c0_g1_i1.p1 TRINITY_DN13232_c0_g1~~TRINITY_DN13232_c0_g1_i1.p1  ORF type:complete len:1056 (-),score=133.31 TRINITY_DN13232_c0_g1_i1:62-3229(-)